MSHGFSTLRNIPKGYSFLALSCFIRQADDRLMQKPIPCILFWGNFFHYSRWFPLRRQVLYTPWNKGLLYICPNLVFTKDMWIHNLLNTTSITSISSCTASRSLFNWPQCVHDVLYLNRCHTMCYKAMLYISSLLLASLRLPYYGSHFIAEHFKHWRQLALISSCTTSRRLFDLQQFSTSNDAIYMFKQCLQ